MPELPDVTLYIEALEKRVLGSRLEGIRIGSPFLLRSVEPPAKDVEDHRVVGLRRLGKRIVFGFEDDLFVVLHLMIAGRLHWRPPGVALTRKSDLAAFDFADGTLTLTEAGSKRRASLHVVRGEAALAAHDPGGIEPLDCDADAFNGALARENHTLKRALTDPRLISGIGNAYSDEILHRAQLSPVRMAASLNAEEMARLFAATRAVLIEWIERLRAETADGFPERVTAFRKDMAVHGWYRQPCPVCATPVQRIVYASNETNYCPRCQTGGRMLADRALSRLLKGDWPRTVDEWERRT